MNSPEFVAALARAYTLSEIFPLHHPTVRDAFNDVAEWLETVGPDVVQVSRMGLARGESAIADPHGHLREFARDLSMAGVSEFGLNEGLDKESVERLLTGLRLVTEDPELALEDFLAREGGCAVELGFHGAPRAAVPAAIAEPLRAPLTEPLTEPLTVLLPEPVPEPVPEPLAETLAEPFAETLPELLDEPLAKTLPEPLAEILPEVVESPPQVDMLALYASTVEEEVDQEVAQAASTDVDHGTSEESDDSFELIAAESYDASSVVDASSPIGDDPQLLIEPVGAFLARDLEEHPEPDFAIEVTAEPEASGAVEAAEAHEWQTEVRARLFEASNVEPELTSPAPAFLAGDLPEASSLPTFEVPDVDVPEVELTDGLTDGSVDESVDEPNDEPTEVPSYELEPTEDVDPYFDPEEASLAQDPPTTIEAWARADLPEEADAWAQEVEDHQADMAGVRDLESEALTLDEPAVQEATLVDALNTRESDTKERAWYELTPTEPTNGVGGVEPVIPVLDESEMDLPEVAAPPVAHAATPEDTEPAPDDGGQEHAPHLEQVHAFRAALRDAEEEHPPEPNGGPVEPAWSPAPDDDLNELWDAEASKWVDGRDPFGGNDGRDDYIAREDEFDDAGEPFPGVEALAPDGPSLWEDAEGADDLNDSGLNGSDLKGSDLADPADLHEADGVVALDPEVAQMENELAAESGFEDPQLEQSDLEVEVIEATHSEPEDARIEAAETGLEPGAAGPPAADPHTLASEEPVEEAVTAEAAPADSLTELAERYVHAQQVERSDLGSQIVDEAQRLHKNDKIEPLREAVEALIRDAVPGDQGAVAMARSLCQPSVVDSLCSALAEVRDPDRRDELVYVFGQLSEVMASALATELSEVPPRAARRNYMDALFRMKADAVAVAIPMLDDSRWFIVRNGVDILGEAGDGSAISKLAPTLAHPDHRVRRATVMAMAKLGSDKAGAELLPVLGDPSAEVREATAMALGHLRVIKALRPLLELMDQDKEDDAQLVILRSLGQLGDPGAVPAIEKRAVGRFFKKPNKAVRIAAYRALAAIGTPHARSLVLEAVQDRDPEVAATARTLAAQLGPTISASAPVGV